MSVAYGQCYSNGSLFKFSNSLINCTRPSIQLHHRQPSAQRSRGSVQAVPSAFQSKSAERVDPHTGGVDRGSAQPIDEYRRSTGICLVNRQGLVFAARYVRTRLYCTPDSDVGSHIDSNGHYYQPCQHQQFELVIIARTNIRAQRQPRELWPTLLYIE